MSSSVALAFVMVALAGAIASWVAGAMFTARAVAAVRPGSAWLAVAFWPMTRGRLPAVPERDAAINKALVAFIACVLVALAATAAATNLQHIAQ